MFNKHVKIYLIPLVIRDKQIKKNTLRYHFISTRMTHKKIDNNNGWQDVKKISYIASRDVKWCSHFRK